MAKLAVEELTMAAGDLEKDILDELEMYEV